MAHTSHAALYSIAAQVAGNVANSVCGSPVDLTLVSVPGILGSLAALFLDMYKRWHITK